MSEDLFVWMARAMYLAIFPIAYVLLARAWRVGVRRDMKRVADWHGRTLPNAERWAPAYVTINFLAASFLLGVAFATLAVGVSFQIWASLVALAVWLYYFALQIVSLRAKRTEAS